MKPTKQPWELPDMDRLAWAWEEIGRCGVRTGAGNRRDGGGQQGNFVPDSGGEGLTSTALLHTSKQSLRRNLMGTKCREAENRIAVADLTAGSARPHKEIYRS